MLPPPFPFVPFLVAAGALQYSQRKFLAALTLGRGTRYTIVAGRVRFKAATSRSSSPYDKPALIFLIGRYRRQHGPIPAL